MVGGLGWCMLDDGLKELRLGEEWWMRWVGWKRRVDVMVGLICGVIHSLHVSPCQHSSSECPSAKPLDPPLHRRPSRRSRLGLNHLPLHQGLHPRFYRSFSYIHLHHHQCQQPTRHLRHGHKLTSLPTAVLNFLIHLIPSLTTWIHSFVAFK